MRSAALVLAALAGCASASTEENAPDTASVPVLSTSFEDASASCNGWTAEGGATAIRSVPARTGDYACKVCGDMEALALSRTTDPLPAGRYVLTAYLRTRPGVPGPVAAQVVLGGVASRPVALHDDDYAVATVAIELDESSTLDARIVGNEDGKRCFLVDDVLVERE